MKRQIAMAALIVLVIASCVAFSLYRKHHATMAVLSAGPGFQSAYDRAKESIRTASRSAYTSEHSSALTHLESAVNLLPDCRRAARFPDLFRSCLQKSNELRDLSQKKIRSVSIESFSSD